VDCADREFGARWRPSGGSIKVSNCFHQDQKVFLYIWLILGLSANKESSRQNIVGRQEFFSLNPLFQDMNLNHQNEK
jgi:hypothetical protein